MHLLAEEIEWLQTHVASPPLQVEAASGEAHGSP
jgi:hypothetical protein